jgi:YjjG family noncanonical pyrimidine nucleotidase
LVRALLFDLDRTLLDFDRAQRHALRTALRERGLPFSPRVLAAYREINEALWAAYRRGAIAQGALEVERFARLLAQLGARRRGAGSLSRSFLARLSERGDLLPGCRSLLRSLKARYRLGVVTNGIDRVQRARLRAASLEDSFETVVTSEGCGYAKPDPRILLAALRELEVDPEAAVYVGDDVAVDGGAAAAAGLRFLWVDRGDALPPGLPRPEHRVRHLREIAERLAL